MENSIEVLQKPKNRIAILSKEFHTWVYTQKKMKTLIQKGTRGASLVVQWLRLRLPMGSIPGRGAVLHALWRKNQSMKNRSNVVTNSIRTLKMIHIKKILKKKKRYMHPSVYSNFIYNSQDMEATHEPISR